MNAQRRLEEFIFKLSTKHKTPSNVELINQLKLEVGLDKKSMINNKSGIILINRLNWFDSRYYSNILYLKYILICIIVNHANLDLIC